MSRKSVSGGRDRSGSGVRGGVTGGSQKSAKLLRADVNRLERELEALRDLHASLEIKHEEQRELYELAPLPAVTLDAAYTVRRLNHAAALLLGDLPERICDQSVRGFVAAADRPKFSQHLARAAAEQASTQCVRLRLQPPHAEPIPVEVWTRFSLPLARFELRMLDLREQERMEEKARRLTQSERAAREESAAKDKFIAVLSHELRAPLTPVLAMASAFRRRPLSQELRDTFAMIERNVAAESRLIDDLLDVNRIVRDKMHVDAMTTDVHEIALQAVENLRPEAQAKRQQVEIHLSAAHSRAKVDPARLRQVFSNLLKNAIKFTPEEGTLRLVSWNGENSIAVELEDDGIGIDPGVMQRLFEPFAEERGPRAGGGLGLGLTICKGLVELQGGRIAAHSRGLGHGTRFVVEFPTTEERVPEVSSRPLASASPATAETRLPRVLLIEDHTDTVEVITALLVDRGFSVESATSLEGARRIDLERVDVIVSDIGLPDGTGIDLMRELQAGTRRPAIALTGFGMETDVRATKAAGFDLHLTKPVSIERLVEAIHSLTPSDV
jgi:signal transduction histidine kinase